MNVCYYTAAWRGGEAWYAYALAQSMANAGVKFSFLAARAELAEREVSHPNVRRKYIMSGTGGRRSAAFRAVVNLYRLLQITALLLIERFRTRVFLVTHPPHWLLATYLQFLILRLTGARIIYIVHDARPHAWAFSQKLRGFEEWMLTQTYVLSAHIIVLTKAAKADLIQYFGIDTTEVDVVPHGAFAVGETSSLPNDGKLLLFGMLRRNKRVKDSIEAMLLLGDELPQVKLLIAGAPYAGEKDYWDECAALIATNPGRFITEIGFVSEERVPDLFRMSDAVLLPYEAFNSQSGVAVLTALSRRPILSSGAGGIGELVEHGLACEPVEVPVTASTIAASIRRFYARPAEEWRAEADKGAELLGHHLSWSRIAQETIRIIDKFS